MDLKGLGQEVMQEGTKLILMTLICIKNNRPAKEKESQYKILKGWLQ